MITQAESGLSSTQYANMQTIGLPEALRVTAYKSINGTVPGLTNQYLRQTPSTPQPKKVVRGTFGGFWYILDYDGTLNRSAPTTAPSSTFMSVYATGVRELHVDNAGRVFIYRGTAPFIREMISTTGVSTTETISISGTPISIACSDEDNLFYFKQEGTKNNYRLWGCVRSGVSSWVELGYDIYMPGYVKSANEPVMFMICAAKSTGVGASGSHVIAFKVVLPGPVKIQTDGTTVTRYTTRESIIMSMSIDGFTVSNNVVVYKTSDPSLGNCTIGLQLQFVGTRFMISTRVVYQDYVNSTLIGAGNSYVGISLSSNGENWSQVQRMNTVPFGTFGFIGRLHVVDNRIYMTQMTIVPFTINRNMEFLALPKSPEIYAFSSCDPGVDLTHFIQSWDAAMNGMLQVNMELTSGAVVAAGDTLRHEGGKILPGDTLPTYIQIGVTEIDSLETMTTVAPQGGSGGTIRVSSRDALSYMTDKITSKDAYEFDAYKLGLDDYDSGIDPNYGGLAHTAIQSGAWNNTVSGQLQMTTVGDGYVYTTYGTNEWNGVATVFLTHPAGPVASGYVGARINNGISNGSFAGVFAGNTLLINHGRGGVYAQVTATVTYGVTRWITAEWKYGRITASTSINSGTSWQTLSLIIDYAYCVSTWGELTPCLESFSPTGPGNWGLYSSQPVATNQRFLSYRFYTLNQALTLENAVKKAAAFAGIGTVKSYDLLTTGVITAPVANSLVTLSGTMATYSQLPNCLEFEYTATSATYIDYLVNSNVRFSAGVDSSNRPIIQWANVSTGVYSLLHSGPGYYSGGGIYRIVFRTVITGTANSSIWYTAAIYRNGFLIAVAGERQTNLPFTAAAFTPVLYGTAVNPLNLTIFTSSRLAELCEPIETMTIDPGENPASSLQRALESRHVLFYIRPNGQLCATRYQDRAGVTLADGYISSKSSKTDLYGLKTSYRIIASTFEREVYGVANAPQERFTVYSTGAVTDPTEALREATREISYKNATANQFGATHPWLPFLEYLDQSPSGILTSWSLSFRGGQMLHNTNGFARDIVIGKI